MWCPSGHCLQKACSEYSKDVDRHVCDRLENTLKINKCLCVNISPFLLSLCLILIMYYQGRLVETEMVWSLLSKMLRSIGFKA